METSPISGFFSPNPNPCAKSFRPAYVPPAFTALLFRIRLRFLSSFAQPTSVPPNPAFAKSFLHSRPHFEFEGTGKPHENVRFFGSRPFCRKKTLQRVPSRRKARCFTLSRRRDGSLFSCRTPGIAGGERILIPNDQKAACDPFCRALPPNSLGPIPFYPGISPV